MLSKYRIFETEEFRKKIDKLQSKDSKIVGKKLKEYAYPQLREEPFYGNNVKKLKGYDPDTWRYRIGKYRLFYVIDVEDRIIYMLTIDDRKDAYK